MRALFAPPFSSREYGIPRLGIVQVPQSWRFFLLVRSQQEPSHTTLSKDLNLAYAIGRLKKLRNLDGFGDSMPRFPHTLVKDLSSPDHPISWQIPRILPVDLIGHFEKSLFCMILANHARTPSVRVKNNV